MPDMINIFKKMNIKNFLFVDKVPKKLIPQGKLCRLHNFPIDFQKIFYKVFWLFFESRLEFLFEI